MSNEYPIEVIFSTDGKHSVFVRGKNKEEMDELLPYGKAVYEKIVAAYGTKQAQAAKAYAKQEGFPNDSGPIAHEAQIGVPTCPKHHKPFTSGKFGWYCKTPAGTDENGKTLWCKEKPKEGQLR